MNNTVLPVGMDIRSIVCAVVDLPIDDPDLLRFQRKLLAGRWRGQRKRQKAGRRLSCLSRSTWSCATFSFGMLATFGAKTVVP